MNDEFNFNKKVLVKYFLVVRLEIDKEHLSYRTLFHSKADQNKHMTNQYLFKMWRRGHSFS